MTSRDFAYWLQGFFEISTADTPLAGLSPEKVAMIQRHLSLVFKHEIDPSLDGGDLKTRIERQTIHDGSAAPDGFVPYTPNWPRVEQVHALISC